MSLYKLLITNPLLILLTLTHNSVSVAQYDKLTGVSCNLVDNQLYILGGTYFDNLSNNNNYIIKVDLDKAHESTNPDLWKTLNPSGYRAPGPYLTSTVDPINKIIYYLGGEIKADDVNIFRFDTTTQENKKLAGSPLELRDVRRGQRYLDQEPLFVNSSFVYNEAGKFILCGGTKLSHTKVRRHELFAGVSLFDSVLDQWTSYPSEFIKDGFRVTAIYRGILYMFGPGVHDQNVVVTFNPKDKLWSTVHTKGKFPPPDTIYSYTQSNSDLFLVGSSDPSKDIIYKLDLINFEWSLITVPDFIGFPEGCLVSHNHHLYHVTGFNNTLPLQIINQDTWSLHHPPSPQPQARLESTTPLTETKSTIIWTSIISIFLAVSLLLTLRYFYLRYRRSRGGWSPPDFIHDHQFHAIPVTPTSIRSSTFLIQELKPEECFDHSQTPKFSNLVINRMVEPLSPTYRNRQSQCCYHPI